jgi:tetratricopeptide (TPR) repeat protein
MLALRGYEIECIARPAMLHLFHQSRTDARSGPWRALALEYARSVTVECEAGGRPRPLQWQELIALCRQLAEAPDDAPESGELDEHIIRLSELSVPIVANNFVVLDAAKATVSAPSVFFFNLADRLDAGDALYKAKWQEDRGRLDEARRLYWQAVEKAPDDPGTLSSCGNYLFRQGDLAQAAMLLRKAVERAPDSAMLLNSLGSALGRLGRDQEAILCFERALQVDPLYGTSYYNLVIALYPRDAHREIIGRLEDLVRQTPDVFEGQHWLGEIRKTLARLEGRTVADAVQSR